MTAQHRARGCGPYYRPVNPVWVAVVALVGGSCAGALLMWVSLRRRRSDPAPTFESAEPVVPAGVAEVLAALNSTAVVGSQDQVLQATVAARTLGLVRGSRIAEPRLLDLIRTVRRERDVVTTELQVTTLAGAPVSYLSVRVAPLDEDLILVLADDQTGARRTEQILVDFVANVSHELKTLIGAISLLAEAVEEAADDPVRTPFRQPDGGRVGAADRPGGPDHRPVPAPGRQPAGRPGGGRRGRRAERGGRPSSGGRRAAAGHADHRRASGSQVLGSARQLGVAVGNLVENAVVHRSRCPGGGHRRLERTGEDDVVEIRVSTTASVSRRVSWSASSSGSTGSTTRAAGPTAAPASVWPSSSTSPPSTAGT